MGEIRRKVVGQSEITTEEIKKERVTRNVTTQTIIRRIVKVIDLECGHKIEATKFNVVPAQNTRCHECEQLELRN